MIRLATFLLIACGSPVDSADLTTGGTGLLYSTTSATAPAAPLPTYDGSLEDARDHILGELSVGRDSEAWNPPSDDAIANFVKVGRRLAQGDQDVADLLTPHGYEALLIPSAQTVVVWEVSASAYSGALLVGLGQRRHVVFEAPHSQFDSLTGEQAFDAFVELQGRAWLVNTAHRCANAASTTCDGTSSACDGSSVPYRASDSAHNTQSLFQALHEGLLKGDDALVAVQLHGFSHDGSEPHAYVSDGTEDDAGPNWLSNAVADALSARISGASAASCNDAAASHRLCGTSNTQGRDANDVNDSCNTSTSSATGRFLHVEQSKALRDTEGANHRGLLFDALDAALP